MLESVFGNDPLNAPISSKPAEVLEHAKVRGDWVVWDANDNVEMQSNIRRAIAEERIVIGASGAIGGFAREYLPERPPRKIALPKPAVVLCGSLNPLSRQQIDAIGVRVQTTTTGIEFADDTTVIATPIPEGEITDAEAVAMAEDAAAMLRKEWERIGTLVVIGGDTAAAIVGDDALEVHGHGRAGDTRFDVQRRMPDHERRWHRRVGDRENHRPSDRRRLAHRHPCSTRRSRQPTGAKESWCLGRDADGVFNALKIKTFVARVKQVTHARSHGKYTVTECGLNEG